VSAETPAGGFVMGLLVPGLPQPLLCPELNPGWTRLRHAFEQAREEIRRLRPDLLVVYSTMWTSIIGHQIQADPERRTRTRCCCPRWRC